MHAQRDDVHPDEDAATRAWRSLTAVFLARKESFPQIAAAFGLNPGAMHALLSLDSRRRRDP